MDDLKSPAHFETVPLNHPSTPLSQHHLRTHQQAQQQQQNGQPNQTPRRHRRDPSYDQHDDDEDDYDDSITDVESEHDRHIRLSLVEEGDYMHSRPMRRRRQSRVASGGGVLAAIKEHRWLIDTGLLVMIMFLLLFRPQRGRDHFWEGAGDLTGFAPECEFSSSRMSFRFSGLSCWSLVHMRGLSGTCQSWSVEGGLVMRNPEFVSRVYADLFRL